ncbi:2-octaprenyl-6-methoxyphenyl hydroxylase [Luteimonas deserti]|uniref:2-octaprenyl-6-methoxyphenyl hydroxylase n=1 Tax=Luteimonas deserti TaxID=2752306 RepID=A0A7Z0TXR9_9GAMM|nr:2-octaprenyl-6-methoxyphenyl hydroxylase [Luteimonas deserti]NYZ61642.1 2-octaprenyl-6-methoxyphenyl hydroxylase [Luteimonas deserti]
MDHVHQVAIVGGGLVGASLAIALDRAGIDAALVEATPDGAMPAVFDQRNLSFAEASVNALTALGVLQKLATPPGPIRRIHVSRAGDFGRVCLDAQDYDRAQFGQVVVARDFGLALDARLAEARHVARYRPARLTTLARDEAGRPLLHLEGADGPQRIAAALVVAADGSDSQTRAALGIDAAVHDYRQALFVARLRTARPPDGVAYERLTASGPTALLPRGDRHYGLVHGVDADDAGAVAALDDAAFLARVQDTFGWRAGRFVDVGPRSRYALRRVVASRLTAPRAALVGNAAQTLHPVGAQGFNLGLRDALTLAELVTGQPDPGAPGLLEAYAARRREDRAATLGFSDGLARLTSNPSLLLRPLRSLGLLVLERDAGLRAALASGAMGYRGQVPALCRAGGA